jgi:hypothetical protein
MMMWLSSHDQQKAIATQQPSGIAKLLPKQLTIFD